MASFGFGTITSQGVGANLDIAGIVNKLMDIERIPLNRLEEQKTSFDAKISALGTIKSSFSALQTALASLTSGAGIQANKATSSDSAIVQATGGSGAVAGNYTISNIGPLAQSQKLVAAGQADATAAIGAGTSTTLTIDLGTVSGTFDPVTGTYSGASFDTGAEGSFDVVIDSSNNTLEGIRDAINAANQGVSATIVNDGDPTNPYRLVLSSTNTGADQSIQISVAGDATLDGLLRQEYALSGVQNLSETVTARDVTFEVDGIPVTKSSNSVTDVISGVTLDLVAESAGPVTIAVSQDTDSAKESVKAFVQAYNDLLGEINKQTDSGYSGGEAGALASDSATRQLLGFVRDELTQAPTGLTGTTYTNLTSIGVSFQRDGTLALDETQLDAAIQDDSSNVAELFSSADGYATRLDTVLTDLLAFGGTIELRTTAYKDRISSLENQKVTLEGRLERTEARLRAKFTALDVLVGSMSVTSNYLTQQLDILNAQTSN